MPLAVCIAPANALSSSMVSWPAARAASSRFRAVSWALYAALRSFATCSVGAAPSGRSATRAPIRLLPQRRWWSRKLSGLSLLTVASHRLSLASSTASGFRSTP